MLSAIYHPITGKAARVFGCDNCGIEATESTAGMPPGGWYQDEGFGLGAGQPSVITCSKDCRDAGRVARGIKTFQEIQEERATNGS